jgi:hypothetical protein
MRVAYLFDDQELVRERYLKLVENTNPDYRIKPDPIYQPVRDLFVQYKNSGYPFILQDLLLATAVKMFAQPLGTKQLQRRGLFATAGLYLALDIKHADLAIRRHFGDFTAGFSHQFGVGLAVLSMSRAFTIPYDQMNPLPVQGRPVMDYKAVIPTGGTLLLEAKGVTGLDGISSARRSIYKKKETARQDWPGSQTAMIGVIVQAALENQPSSSTKRKRANEGAIEIIDPEFEHGKQALSETDIRVGIYRHYAGIATFAGLYDIAKELFERASATAMNKSRAPRLQKISFFEREAIQRGGKFVVGIQWRPGDETDHEDVWFYQAVDRDILRNLIVNDSVPHTGPYTGDSLLERHRGYAETLFPDGSYFGIGTTPLPGLRILHPRDLSFKDLSY